MSAYQHTSLLVSTREHLWVRCYMAPSVIRNAKECPWLLLRSHECPLLYRAKLMSLHDCSWVLMAVYECSWLLLAAYECTWVLTGTHECPWLYMITHEQQWTLISLVPWNNENSLALMSAYGPIAPYSWALMSDHECLWKLMSAH